MGFWDEWAKQRGIKPIEAEPSEEFWQRRSRRILQKKTSHSLILGEVDDGTRALFTPQPNDTLRMIVLGAPGYGKTHFLAQVIEQFQKWRPMPAGVLLDWKGDLYNLVLQQMLANDRYNSLYYLDTRAPALCGFDPCQGEYHSLEQHSQALAEATLKVWGEFESQETRPTLERWLPATYLAVLENGLTLKEAYHMVDFTDNPYRPVMIENMKTDRIKSEWLELLELKNRRYTDFRSELMSTRNRLHKFLFNPVISTIIGMKKRSIVMQNILRDGGWLLVNLRPFEGGLTYR